MGRRYCKRLRYLENACDVETNRREVAKYESLALEQRMKTELQNAKKKVEQEIRAEYRRIKDSAVKYLAERSLCSAEDYSKRQIKSPATIEASTEASEHPNENKKCINHVSSNQKSIAMLTIL